MHGRQATGHGEAMELAEQERVMRQELVVRSSVSHVRFRVGIDEQVAKWRRVDGEVHRLARKLREHRNAVAVIGRVVLTVSLRETLDSQDASVSHAGSRPAWVGL